ncbi:uridine kinase family protein [Frondihabitans sucicola]|nr:AAA family ATPase [Frondihabitans sucicola]
MSGTRLVAVDGPSGSGKSTLAGPLADRLRAPLVPIDDFVSWNDFAGWWPRFEAQVLEPLLTGHDAVYQQRDWKGDEFGDRLGPWRRVPASPVVVIEGVTSSRRAVADRLACSVWVEAPAAVRLERGLARDGEDHREVWQKWMVEEAVFFERDGTRSRADFTTSGGADASS